MAETTEQFKVNPQGEVASKVDVESKNMAPSRAAKSGEIPIIDVSCLFADDDDAKKEAARQIRLACERIGFFYIVNHGVEKKSVADAFSATRQFFDQPDTFKKALLFDKNDHGYKGPGNINLPGYIPDYKEVLDFGVDLDANHPDVVSGKPFHGVNQWPDLPGFRASLLHYYDEVSQLAYQLMRLFALALDLEETYFLPFHDNAHVTWRVMRYFPGDYQKGQYGTAPHTDFGTITLLAQDALGGLEVYSRDDEWIQAPYVEDSFVVNIGDLMACWTNDRFRSTAHRVLNHSDQSRYSIPMFYNPDFDTVAECLSTCCSTENPPHYDPIHYGDYITGIYSRIYSGGKG